MSREYSLGGSASNGYDACDCAKVPVKPSKIGVSMDELANTITSIEKRFKVLADRLNTVTADSNQVDVPSPCMPAVSKLADRIGVQSLRLQSIGQDIDRLIANIEL